jgi:hypothetical protein
MVEPEPVGNRLKGDLACVILRFVSQYRPDSFTPGKAAFHRGPPGHHELLIAGFESLSLALSTPCLKRL